MIVPNNVIEIHKYFRKGTRLCIYSNVIVTANRLEFIILEKGKHNNMKMIQSEWRVDER